MAYIVLPRKYRPKTFAEILGQEHVVTTLINAINENKLSHGYIFSGQRGTGKTTTARVLAKSLNCLSSSTPTISPCGSCVNCKEIEESISVDVIEIDAASNRGINEIRALRENVKYAPANSRYKIYIIDESHQITEEGFNAFLKTLEEPPKGVLFILATTQPQKIPLTILSRCQHFRFKPIPLETIMKGLKNIIKLEKYKINDEAIKLIAMAGNGSFRDALSLLDQVTSYVTDTEITSEHIKSIVGLTPEEIINNLLIAISNKNTEMVLKIINDISNEGYDFSTIAKDLRDTFRAILFYKYGLDFISFYSGIENYTEKFKEEEIIRNIQIIENCINQLRWTEQPRLTFELHLLRISQEFIEIKEIIQNLHTLELKIKTMPEPIQKETIQEETITKIEEPQQTITPSYKFNWNEILEQIKTINYEIGRYLSYANVSFSDNTLTLNYTLPIYREFVISCLDEIKKILKDITKTDINVNITPTDSEEIVEKAKSEEMDEIPLEPPEWEKEEPQIIDEDIIINETEKPEDETISQILKMFGGKVIKN